MQKIRLVLHGIDITNEWVGRISCYLVIAVMLVAATEVILRYAFNNPTSWAWPVSIQLAAVFALLAGGYNVLHNVHVKVDVLYTRFPDKVRVIIDLVLSIFFFLLCIVLIGYGGELAWESVAIREYLPDVIHSPIYPLKMLVVIASFLVFLQGVARFVRNLTLAITGKEV